jgi:hypothetical protein
VHGLERNLTEARAEFQKAATLDDLPWYKANLGYVYAVSGDRAKAEQILRDLDDLAKKQYVSPALPASVYLASAKGGGFGLDRERLRRPGSHVVVEH